MTKNDYFNYLVQTIHSATVATIGRMGILRPVSST